MCLLSELEHLEGCVERITFQSEDTGYTILQLDSGDYDEPVTVVGEMPAIFVGENMRFQGLWTQHQKYGKQFKAQRFEKVRPTTIIGLQRYLASGMIKGVGPITARRLIRAFGQDVIHVIEKEPERLLEIPLIGKSKRDEIVASWQEHKGIQNVMIFLQEHDVSTGYAVKIYKRYGAAAVDIVQENPYQLAEDVWGIGFKIADQLARKLGIEKEYPARLQAGLLFALQRAVDDGHVYVPQQELVQRAAELLEVPAAGLPEQLSAMYQQDRLVLAGEPENPLVFLRSLWMAEAGIAERLGLLQQATLDQADPEALQSELETWIADYETEQGIDFSEEQREAIVQAAQHKVFILTGGPGTGKTTVSRAILDWFQHQGLTLALASPTGRAAKRLAEVSGRPATTLHRLLEFDPRMGAFQRNEYTPLEVDLVLIDEISMVDTALFYHCLDALPAQARLILVGDSDQLPSVGPGSVLQDLRKSGVVGAVALKTIYRQAQSSRIVQNAHLVNQGEMPVLLPVSGRHREEDAFFISTAYPQDTLAQVTQLLTTRLPAIGYATEDIQVLCPMNRGVIGTQSLNKQLQEALNPEAQGKAQLVRGERLLRVGDRVIQMRNNYDQDVFNGDMGIIEKIDVQEHQVTVKYPERQVVYESGDLDEIRLAYALTIHKSQGSEFPVVVMVLTRQHHMMLQRKLLYTGMTRARQLFILVGQPEAIQQAVENHFLRPRYTLLAQRLKKLT
jgi:exodeoxyribonuclease V alpha subunit